MRRLCGTTTVTGLAIIEVTDPKAILEHCTAAGRTSEPERVARRLGHGLRFCSLLENGQIVANTWLIRSGARFLDEAMLKFELHSDASCLRDLYVRPESRGQRIFARFIGMLESGPLVGKRELWSCVDADNRASRAAHSHAGFELPATVSSLLDNPGI
mgnify:CR=1 FL=1